MWFLFLINEIDFYWFFLFFVADLLFTAVTVYPCYFICIEHAGFIGISTLLSWC